MKVVIISNLYELTGKITVHPKYFPIIAHSKSFAKYQLKKLNVSPADIYLIPFTSTFIDDTPILKEISPKSEIITEDQTSYFKIKKQNYSLFLSLIILITIIAILLPITSSLFFLAQLLIIIIALTIYLKNRYYKNNYTLIKDVL